MQEHIQLLILERILELQRIDDGEVALPMRDRLSCRRSLLQAIEELELLLAIVNGRNRKPPTPMPVAILSSEKYLQ